MSDITIRDMFAAGIHYGHQTRFWNPKMGKYIYTKQNKIHILDLDKTLPLLKESLKFIKNLVKGRKQIIFIGTKRSAQEVIAKHADRCGMPYVNQRWLGGTFTNFKTVRRSIQRYRGLKEEYEQNDFDYLSKKQRLLKIKEFDKLRKILHGIKDLTRIPDAVFIIDVSYESIAVKEATKLGLPVTAVVDSNNSLENIDYPIPGNDDAMSAIELYASAVADAVLEGIAEQSDEIVPEELKKAGDSSASGQEGLKVTTKKSGRIVKRTTIEVKRQQRKQIPSRSKSAKKTKETPSKIAAASPDMTDEKEPKAVEKATDSAEQIDKTEKTAE